MSDSGYTPSTERVRDAFVLAENHDCYYEGDVRLTPDGQVSYAEFDSWLAAHDVVIREDQAKKDATLIEEHVAEFEASMARLESSIEDPVNTDAGREYDILKLHGQRGAKYALRRLGKAIRGQSFTGTESETNGK